MNRPIFLLYPLCFLIYAGCQQKDVHSIDEIGKQTFQVKGVVQEIRTDGDVLVIDHEEIPGYMRQMIMPFRVGLDESLPKDLNPGDEIAFTYEVEEVKSWISDISKTGETREVKLASFDDLPDPDGVEILSIGDQLPDYKFLDENGEDVKLSDYRGMPVALTFVFSRCPLPEYCPAMMRNFNEVEEHLKSDPDAPEKWKILSISFDTFNDTPETMKAYGTAYGKDTDNWGLLSTDDCCTIREFGGNVGLKFADKGGSLVHNLRTVVLNSEGTITRIFTDETWQIDELISEIKQQGKQASL